MKKAPLHKKSSQSGNIFFMLFASVALIGAVTVGASNTFKGLVSSMADVTKKTIAEEKMTGAARLAIQASTTVSAGDCDGDGVVEPLPYRDAGSAPHPVGGGWVPANIGATDKDPWGTPYGYCVWDPGTVTVSNNNAGCGGSSAKRLDGSTNSSQTVVAVISAGKDRRFSTTCAAQTGGGGGWTPADLATAPLVWFDAQTPASIVHTAGAVTTWTDRAHSRVAILDGGSASPTYSATGFEGGLPGITFSGQRMYGSLLTPASGNVFGFLVFDWSGSGGVFGQVTSVNSGNAAWNNDQSMWMGHINANDSVLFMSSTGHHPSPSPWSTTGDILYAGARSSVDQFFGGMNGATPALLSTAGAPDLNATTSYFYIGGDVSDNNYHGLGTIGEIIWLGYEPNATERQNIEGYLAHKWGLAAKLPGGHPYKAAPPGGGGGGGGGVTRAAGGDDIVVEYTYDDAAGIGGEDLWRIKDTKPDTAMIDKNIEVAGTTQFGGGMNLLGKGLILPDSTATGACAAGTDQQLRMNFTASPPQLEICDYGGGSGLGWTPVSMGGGGGGGGGTWDPPANLIARWKLDETSGTSIVDSVSGNNGTFTGNASVVSTTGKEGTALSFDGSNDEISVPDNAAWDAPEVTLSAWVKPTSVTGWRTIISRELGITDLNTYGMLIEDMTGQHKFAFLYATNVTNDNFIVSTTTATSRLNQWTHVAVTASATQKRLYINGILEGTTPVPGSPNGTILPENKPLGIGAGYNVGNLDENFAGDIDDVMMYSRALTPAEIMDMYRGTGGWPPDGADTAGSAGNLISHWKLDESSGTTVTDSVGGHNGTTQNSPPWQPTGGKDGGALHLEDSGDKTARISRTDALEPTAVTVAAWVKRDANVVNLQSIVDKTYQNNTGPRHSYALAIDGDSTFGVANSAAFYTNDGSNVVVLNSPSAIPVGVWTHIVGIYDPAGAAPQKKLYVDGMLVASEVRTDPIAYDSTATGDIYFGKNEAGGNERFTGSLDDVRVYNYALSDTEVEAVFTSTGGVLTSGSSNINPGDAVSANANKYRGKLSINESHACAIKPDMSLWCWGDDTDSKIGNGATITAVQTSPSRVNDAAGFVQVSNGIDSTCGIKGDGTLWCWGDDTYGQIGNGAVTTADQASPVAVGTAIWTSVSVGSQYACGIQVNGAAYCWGNDTGQQLGNGAGSGVQTSPSAVVTTSGGTWQMLSTGISTTCGIKADGTMWCWGDDNEWTGGGSGLLGDGATIARQHSPEMVAEPGPWVHVSVGEVSACAIKLDGTMWCWGSNTYGRLGLGAADANPHPVPERVTDLGPWLTVDVSAQSNGATACGIKADGTMWCWGDDGEGRLGNGDAETNEKDSPFMVSDPGPWVDVKASRGICGMKADSSVWCWGNDSYGQLGNGAVITADQTSPGPVFNFPSTPPFRWTGNTVLEAAGASNLALGTAAISFDGTNDTTPLPNGLSFPSSGKTRLRMSTAGVVVPAYTPPANLVGWWKFDENTGTSAADSSGNNYTGTLTSSPVWVTGKYNSGIGVNGSYVNVPDNATLDLTGNSTIAFWMYHYNLPANKDILGKTDGGGVWQYSLQTVNDEFGLYYHNGAGATSDARGYETNSANLVTGRWYFVAQTFDIATDTLLVYLDGVSIPYTASGSPAAGSFKNSAAALRLGWSTYSGSQSDAILDDVMIFNRALSASEITDIYTRGGTASTGTGSELKVETLAANSSAQISLKAASAANTRSIGIDYASSGLEFGLNNGTATNWMDAVTPQMEVLPTGNVGVGTNGTAPFRLTINGGLKVGDDTRTCSSARKGTLRFTTNTPPWQYCNGASWVDF